MFYFTSRIGFISPFPRGSNTSLWVT
ncbi:hypothetical protein LINPERHAP1_LOCUS1180 [Linum perenne]